VNKSQRFYAYSFSLETCEGAKKALEAACTVYNDAAPDALFLCAGTAKPKYFIEMTEEEIVNGMSQGYWVQAWTSFVR
jgi:3-dehydrosphinganine reductase